YITSRFEIISYMLLSPIFFASIGIQVDLSGMSSQLIIFTILLVIIAIASKIIGCGLGAKLCHYSDQEALQVGVGMVSRGEVALIVASKGVAIGLMGTTFFAPVVVMVVVTTILTPILLKIVFTSKKGTNSNLDKKSKLIHS
ncbi:MAG: cation:proton antiporter, partial [Turicibacter sp.]|nr:cation:proton antiporter [Turicibacter sp.]